MKREGLKRLLTKINPRAKYFSSLLPKNAMLAKALGTLAAGSLSKAAFQQPNKAVLFYATDDTSINSDIEQLIVDSGFEPMRVGGLDQSIRIEAFGDLHEFGGFGKTVTSSEAKTKLYSFAH
jgi:predicted dinucleotide-binding enzyme